MKNGNLFIGKILEIGKPVSDTMRSMLGITFVGERRRQSAEGVSYSGDGGHGKRQTKRLFAIGKGHFLQNMVSNSRLSHDPIFEMSIPVGAIKCIMIAHKSRMLKFPCRKSKDPKFNDKKTQHSQIFAC
jgi:hypothetical protein